MGGKDEARGGKKHRVSLDSSFNEPLGSPITGDAVDRGRDADDEGVNRVKHPELDLGLDGGRISSSKGSMSSSWWQ